jgi:hypothetical protein
MHFGTKSYLKSTRNHTAKHALSIGQKNEQDLVEIKLNQSSWILMNKHLFIVYH